MDTTQKPQEKIKGILAQLPTVLKNALYSQETIGKIQTIGSKHLLHLDTVANLEAETNLYIAGIISADEFPEKIKNIVGKETDIESIVHDIDEQIILPLRKKMEVATGKPSVPEGLPTSSFAAKLSAGITQPATTHVVTDVSQVSTSTPTTIVQEKKTIVDPYKEPIE